VPVGRTLARALAGAVGTQLGLHLAGRTRRWVGPLELSARVDLARAGGTTIDIPPLGTATISSHRGPLRVTASATAVDPARASGLLDGPDPEDVLPRLSSTIGDEAGHLGRVLAVRSVVAGLGGAAATAALGLHRRSDIVAAAKSSAALLATAAAIAAATVDREAWRSPELAGLLDRAPLVLGDLQAAPGRISTYRDQLAELVRTGTTVYRRIATLPEPPPADAIRLLHISDLHLSPVAFGLAKAVIDEFAIDAVVDTGDLVDWGTPLEQAFANQIGGLGVPYVFVKGNHDSDGIAAAVARQPNATVLTAEAPVEIAGLRFAGLADPRFTPDKTTGDDHAEHRVRAAAAAFAATLTGAAVDVALAHDPAAGRALQGVVPLVLAGHTHERAGHRFGDTVVLVQGTTGGAGLRGVQREPATPVSLSVVYLERASKRLHSVDEITLGGIGSVSLNVVRRRAVDVA
jgi:predicted MPP superfamily phosphohydrolase